MARRSTSRSGARLGANSHRHQSVDFASQKLGLTYKTSANTDAMPLHYRAPRVRTNVSSVSHRHYAGNFPMARPGTVRIYRSAMKPRCLDYARTIQAELRAHQVRASSTPAATTSKPRSRTRADESAHHARHRHRDLEANAVSVRVHGQGNLGAKPRMSPADILIRSRSAA